MYKSKKVKPGEKKQGLEDKLKQLPSLDPNLDLGKEPRDRKTKEQMLKDTEAKILVKEPNPLVTPICKIPFKVWADRERIPELALSERDAYEFSLHATRILNYYLPSKSPVAMMWIGALGFAGSLILPRMQWISDIKKEKAKAGLKEYLDKEKQRLKCSACGAVLTTEQELKEHLEKEHKK